jgi:hypothetical protein
MSRNCVLSTRGGYIQHHKAVEGGGAPLLLNNLLPIVRDHRAPAKGAPKPETIKFVPPKEESDEEEEEEEDEESEGEEEEEDEDPEFTKEELDDMNHLNGSGLPMFVHRSNTAIGMKGGNIQRKLVDHRPHIVFNAGSLLNRIQYNLGFPAIDKKKPHSNIQFSY